VGSSPVAQGKQLAFQYAEDASLVVGQIIQGKQSRRVRLD
jgi:hypothetical protein